MEKSKILLIVLSIIPLGLLIFINTKNAFFADASSQGISFSISVTGVQICGGGQCQYMENYFCHPEVPTRSVCTQTQIIKGFALASVVSSAIWILVLCGVLYSGFPDSNLPKIAFVLCLLAPCICTAGLIGAEKRFDTSWVIDAPILNDGIGFYLAVSSLVIEILVILCAYIAFWTQSSTTDIIGKLQQMFKQEKTKLLLCALSLILLSFLIFINTSATFIKTDNYTIKSGKVCGQIRINNEDQLGCMSFKFFCETESELVNICPLLSNLEPFAITAVVFSGLWLIVLGITLDRGLADTKILKGVILSCFIVLLICTSGLVGSWIRLYEKIDAFDIEVGTGFYITVSALVLELLLCNVVYYTFWAKKKGSVGFN